MAGTAPSSERWYRDGLRFECTACGKCCTGVPGYVWVTEAEIAAMARFKGQTPERFRRQYVRRVGKRLSLVERKNGDCVLLEGGKCSVYPAKPTPCSTFPFWDGPLESSDAWKETAERCEGIGRGPVYTAAEIDAVRGGDAGVLLAMHAAAAGAAATVPPQGEPPGSERVPPSEGAGATASPDDGLVPEEAWSAALRELEALYADLEKELPKYRFTCSASGACCDFDGYGHRLYATTLEAEWFFRHSPEPRANENERHCPAWGPDRLCKARTGRMLGCRTYFCGPYPNGLPEDVHAPFHARIQALHEKHGIPYRSRDVLDWARGRRPAAPSAPPAS